jgi:hypothetical protein
MRADAALGLVSVLWLLALLALVALVPLTAVRLDMRAAGQLSRHAEAEVLMTMRFIAIISRFGVAL